MFKKPFPSYDFRLFIIVSASATSAASGFVVIKPLLNSDAELHARPDKGGRKFKGKIKVIKPASNLCPFIGHCVTCRHRVSFGVQHRLLVCDHRLRWALNASLRHRQAILHTFPRLTPLRGDDPRLPFGERRQFLDWTREGQKMVLILRRL